MTSLNYQISTLDNGIRVITEQVTHVQFLSLGVWVNVGSRYETEEENGITHCIEHMLFKGTDTRSAEDIASSVDAIGGQINAFTSKECTCYYIKTLLEDFPFAIELLSDLVLHSKLSDEELNKEREVIIEEIKMYEDTPDDHVQDLLAQHMWPNHPLGRTVLGTEETLRGFTGEKLHQYMKQYYTGSNIVVSLVGNIPHQEVVDAVAKLFSSVPKGAKNQMQPAEMPLTGVELHQKEIGQCQICFALPGVAREHEDIYPMGILSAYLGGGMSARLVKEIREKLGLVYSIYAYHAAFDETGALIIAAGTRPENCQTVINMIGNIVEDVAENGIPVEELHKTLAQFKGGMLMGLETVHRRMQRLGRSLLLNNEVITPEEDVARLERVTVEDVKCLAKRITKNRPYQLTVLGDIEEVHI